ncbi:ATP-dependent DNA helicase DDM1-like [Triticum dicoccoides]|uniref:ATP-dependent DNA helicase DDM1-like n=1 Tax=Triticum dicoccoides TaxID=85692 RepID=UPI00188FEB12|nr:ATP-dependent DNA helicase DDM1-like [Triticum dicoccoides]
MAECAEQKLFDKLDRILAMTEKVPTKRSIVDYATLTEEEKQDRGLGWLTSMWQGRVNAVLGDQMGDGEIITTLKFIARLKEDGHHGPYMIVTSLSCIGEWSECIKRFPSINQQMYFGNFKDRAVLKKEFVHKTVCPAFPIILTLHGMVHLEKNWLAQYGWKYVVVDEGHLLDKRGRELVDEVKRQPMGRKLLLMREPFQNNLAELWSLLNFALPSEFSSHDEFDSWFDRSGKEGEDQQTEEERMTLLSKLHAILCPFLLRAMKSDVENRVPQMKGATCYKTKVVQNSDVISITCPSDHAAIKGARAGAQEVAAEVVAESGGESSPNTRSCQLGLEVQGSRAIKRPRTNDALVSLVGKSNPVRRVQVREPTPSESIIKSLKEIPDLARSDILRAYSTLIRDDRQFESLMALPMNMRKDWLLMEIGNR